MVEGPAFNSGHTKKSLHTFPYFTMKVVSTVSYMKQTFLLPFLITDSAAWSVSLLIQMSYNLQFTADVQNLTK
jgi:hypothetical protein